MTLNSLLDIPRPVVSNTTRARKLALFLAIQNNNRQQSLLYGKN
ncbi:hypothetical protein HNQ64_003747 [Prosthecobacter dejongeii]|uniref:Uncharacterized protein n=1 Tax=Prosthecobacter dejongeii TaxID=48465 RepID=A0A7W7YNK0_9BACT|nr:hypothetical protein [Prosthecobacter dejongeii]